MTCHAMDGLPKLVPQTIYSKFLLPWMVPPDKVRLSQMVSWTIYGPIGGSSLPQMVPPRKTLVFAVDIFSMHPKVHARHIIWPLLAIYLAI